ncbi:nucleotide kinase domain-containing protein [Zunongwangia pacifica]|uniref:5-hmdU DNA kinase helical domain-containing protein n=1 Tax=Zunongwangia pacifica TaxID=2911062 RepID=A0A9X2CNF7_9FLAO|nr:nucleotide kinase domain-containing protein [Zunongwangia pacifica]MCL6216918.1 hypothetical protein [Zunongwangia pacifica]
MSITIEKNKTFTIYKPLLPAETTEVFDSYWKFAALRQEVFFNRIEGVKYPWTNDTILAKHRFTNAYRASDRVSQYLIREVIYNTDYSDTPNEVLFRILLFKLFNKIETWELLKSKIGNLEYAEFDFNKYDNVLSKAFSEKKTIYSAAYIMPSVKQFGHKRKHSNHLELIDYILKKDTSIQLMNCNKMQQAFDIVKSFPGLGDFLAYQILIDINYSNIIDFSESEFVVPGPGALGGISKCFKSTGGLTNVEIIRLMVDRQEMEFERLGLDFKTLWGRRLQLIDCQNLFCEVDKYARVKHPEIKGNSDRTRIKQVYKLNTKPIDYWFPPKWGINVNINSQKLKQNESSK